MDLHTYWYKQTPKTPLYPDIEWTKPEQRAFAGRLGIVGGNTLGFVSVAESYITAKQTGAGEVRVLLPDVLRKTIPPTITDTTFGATNPSGGLSKDTQSELDTMSAWSTGMLMIGDAGRNSETAILYENFLLDYKGPLTITRDAVDLVKNSPQSLVERPDTLLVVSFAQLQKLFRSVYYPKMLTFSMQLAGVVEAVHKFTITYPCTIMVLHKEHIIVAGEGEVTTTAWENPMSIWRGHVATKAACYWLWNPSLPLKAATASISNSQDAGSSIG